MFIDDSSANPEPEAGAMFAFGGEERLKEMWLHIFRNTGAVVGDRHRRARLLLLPDCVDAGTSWSDADLYSPPGRLPRLRW